MLSFRGVIRPYFLGVALGVPLNCHDILRVVFLPSFLVNFFRRQGVVVLFFWVQQREKNNVTQNSLRNQKNITFTTGILENGSPKIVSAKMTRCIFPEVFVGMIIGNLHLLRQTSSFHWVFFLKKCLRSISYICQKIRKGRIGNTMEYCVKFLQRLLTRLSLMQNSTTNGRPGHRYAWDNVAIRLVLVVLEFFFAEGIPPSLGKGAALLSLPSWACLSVISFRRGIWVQMSWNTVISLTFARLLYKQHIIF